MKDPRNFSDQPVKNNLGTHDIIWKISIGQDDDYTTDCVLDYPYFKKYYKLIVRDLSKQEKLDADPKAMQQVHFTGNLDQDSATLRNWCSLVCIQKNKQYIYGLSSIAVQDNPRIQKISDEYVIKKRWLRTNLT